ncbi:MAG: DEAD/DEAH box helicase [Candidatus Helarchaeota archaeon]
MAFNTEENVANPAIPSQLTLLLRNFKAHPLLSKRLIDLNIQKLNDIQYFSILLKLFEGTNLLVSAPTSSGKTLIGEMACINTILKKRGRCLYLVPLKSLANELLADFREHWQSLGVSIEMSTGDMSRVNPEKEKMKLATVDLLITTYERADSILRSYPDWFKQAQVIIIDEIHTIGSGLRGARLEGLLTRLKYFSEHKNLGFPKFQFIGLSATIGNPHELAQWLDCELIEHTHRPVPLQYQILMHPSRDEKIKEIVRATLLQDGSILIFTPTRYEAEQLCRQLSYFIKEQDLSYQINARELRGAIYDFRERFREQMDQRLFFSMQNGVAFHHAGVASVTKKFIEDTFRQGLIKIITCTPTLSAGVNLPAKVVVIKDVGLLRSHLLIDPNRFHQMCGRAGRPRYDTEGKAIILSTNPGEQNSIQLLYFHPHSNRPKYRPLNSQFMEYENLLEQLLIWIAERTRRILKNNDGVEKRIEQGMKESELQEIVFQTFWYNTLYRQNPDLSLKYMIQIGYYSLENLLLRHSSPKIMREAEQISEKQVNIRQMDTHCLEALIYDHILLKVAFLRDFPSCPCGQFDFHNRYTAPLCRHLVKLAQIAYRQNPSYTKNILLSALHEVQLIDQLLAYRMIQIRNGKLQITDFGYKTFILYLTPKTAYWIRKQLPRIKAHEKFHYALMYVYDLERKNRAKPAYEAALQRLLDENYSDLQFHMQEICRDLEIYPGDMEEFVETIRWIVHCFLTLASLEDIQPVRKYAEEAYQKLIPFNMRIFIIHTREDFTFYRLDALTRYLRDQPAVTQVNTMDDDYTTQIHEDQLETSHIAFFLITERSLNSENCQDLLSFALKKQITVIPILGYDVTEDNLNSLNLEAQTFDSRHTKILKYSETSFDLFCVSIYETLLQYRNTNL